jgi:hypothetical protein
MLRAFYIVFLLPFFAGKQKKIVQSHSALQLQRYNSFWFNIIYLLCTHLMLYKMDVNCHSSLIAVCLPVDCKATTKHDKDERNVSSWPDGIYLQYGTVFKNSRVKTFPVLNYVMVVIIHISLVGEGSCGVDDEHFPYFLTGNLCLPHWFLPILLLPSQFLVIHHFVPSLGQKENENGEFLFCFCRFC